MNNQKNNLKRYEIEARAIVTTILLICYTIIITAIALYRPELFQLVFGYLTIFVTGTVLNFYGAKNHEKRIEQMFNQIPLTLMSQTTRQVIEILKPMLEEMKKKPL